MRVTWNMFIKPLQKYLNRILFTCSLQKEQIYFGSKMWLTFVSILIDWTKIFMEAEHSAEQDNCSCRMFFFMKVCLRRMTKTIDYSDYYPDADTNTNKWKKIRINLYKKRFFFQGINRKFHSTKTEIWLNVRTIVAFRQKKIIRGKWFSRN